MYILAFALQLKKKHGKTTVKVDGECKLAKNINPYIGNVEKMLSS